MPYQFRAIAGTGVVFIALAGIAFGQATSAKAAVPSAPSTYVLGPGDKVAVQVTPDAPEVNGKVWQIDDTGGLTVPMAGAIRAGGLTTHALESALSERYRVYFREPQVIVSLVEMRSQPVSVMGAVNAPGVHQLQGHQTLIQVLALAGGLRSDAGYRVRITRQAAWGSVPLPGAVDDAKTQTSIAEVALQGLMEAADPAQNIAIMPDDVLTVPVAEMVYVIGDVHKSGGFVLGERKSMSVLEALALSEGLGSAAQADQARILRLSAGADSRIELPVDLKKILAGHADDMAMQSKDILFVPVNGAKRVGIKAVEEMLTIGTGLAIYRP